MATTIKMFNIIDPFSNNELVISKSMSNKWYVKEDPQLTILYIKYKTATRNIQFKIVYCDIPKYIIDFFNNAKELYTYYCYNHEDLKQQWTKIQTDIDTMSSNLFLKYRLISNNTEMLIFKQPDNTYLFTHRYTYILRNTLEEITWALKIYNNEGKTISNLLKSEIKKYNNVIIDDHSVIAQKIFFEASLNKKKLDTQDIKNFIKNCQNGMVY